MGARFPCDPPGPLIQMKGDLTAILTKTSNSGDVLFIDEIHRLQAQYRGNPLSPRWEDFKLDIIIGQGPSARTHRLDLRRFTPDRSDHSRRP